MLIFLVELPDKHFRNLLVNFGDNKMEVSSSA